MKITRRYRMRDLPRIVHILDLDPNLSDKIKMYPLPKRIGRVKIKNSVLISFQHIIMSWDIKTENDLYSLTCDIYGLNKNKIGKYRLLDFWRLAIEVSETALTTAKMFKALNRDIKDSELKNAMKKVMEGHKTSASTIFAEIMIASNGAYTQEDAAKMSWKLAYDILQRQTIEFDKQSVQDDIMNKRMKQK